jgi:hypothetical protein
MAKRFPRKARLIDSRVAKGEDHTNNPPPGWHLKGL